jgi:hypothetical protein
MTAATPGLLNAILADPRIDDNSPASVTSTETTTDTSNRKASTSENAYEDLMPSAMTTVSTYISIAGPLQADSPGSRCWLDSDKTAITDTIRRHAGNSR